MNLASMGLLPAVCRVLAMASALVVGCAVVGSPPPASAAGVSDGEAVAQPQTVSAAVPAGRAAKNVVVITIRGPIDRWTTFGVDRRLKTAVRQGADAVVFEIDTPGGDLLATLALCNLIKSSPIANTVAWVNSNAYSAGAIIALSCREIVITDTATLGDALPVQGDPIFGLRPMPEAEREKIYGPLLAEVVDSARRSGYDEMLVQGIVRRGVELWLVEHKESRRRYFVTADQYRLAVGQKPVRREAEVPSATGVPGATRARRSDRAADASEDVVGTTATDAPAEEFLPAAPNTPTSLVKDVNAELELKSTKPSERPNFGSPEHEGQYRDVAYVSDGRGLITLKSAAMQRYGLTSSVVNNDQELQSYFGAQRTVRLTETWSEGLVRFMSNDIVRGILLVIFLIALFIEMTHPGVILPGGIAAVALVALVLPPALINLAAWWMIAAILVGVLLILLEIFVLPGFGVFGVLGVVLLFGGLIGAFVGPGNLFPDSPQEQSDLLHGVMTVLISFVTAGVGIYFLAKHLPSLPFVNRLVLRDDTDEGDPSDLLLSAMETTGPVRIGSVGRALTPLRPAGRIQVGEQILDVVAEIGFIPAGSAVRITGMDNFRTTVERTTDAGAASPTATDARAGDGPGGGQA